MKITKNVLRIAFSIILAGVSTYAFSVNPRGNFQHTYQFIQKSNVPINFLSPAPTAQDLYLEQYNCTGQVCSMTVLGTPGDLGTVQATVGKDLNMYCSLVIYDDGIKPLALTSNNCYGGYAVLGVTKHGNEYDIVMIKKY